MGQEEVNTYHIPFVAKFDSITDQISKDQQIRCEDIANYKFGIDYLDRACCGFRGTDLILIGGESGIGKSSLSVCIAENNPSAKVYYFALEAEQNEVYMRIKYKVLQSLLQQDGSNEILLYDEWVMGKSEHITQRFNDKADEIIKERYRNLYVFYRKNSAFDIAHFTATMHNIGDSADIVVIDHLHYFDLSESSGNENKQYKDIVKGIRDMALIYNKPVILIAHLRKKAAKESRLIASNDDFHGSSDIFKIATKVITMAPYRELMGSEPYMFPTLLRVTKNRINGSVTRYVGMQQYNIQEDRYTSYKMGVGILSKDGSEWQELDPQDYPYWYNRRSGKPRQIRMKMDVSDEIPF